MLPEVFTMRVSDVDKANFSKLADLFNTTQSAAIRMLVRLFIKHTTNMDEHTKPEDFKSHTRK